MKKTIFLLFLAVLPLLGQQAKKIDDTLAIVGDQPLLRSEFESVYDLYATQYRPDTISDSLMRKQLVTQLKAQVFNDLLTTKLFYVAALKDTNINVTDEQVNEQIQNFIDNIKNSIGQQGFNQLLQQLGTNLENFKKMLRWYIREQLYAQAYIDAHVRSKVQVSPQEIDSLYNAMKDSILLTPEMVRIAHILISVKPSKSEEKATEKTAMAIYKKLKKGADFAQLASNYSDDRQTAQNGGYIGFLSRNNLPDTLADKLFALNPGDISEPIKGELGYNIFKCHSKKDDQIELSYILVKYSTSRADTQRALKKAKKILNAIKNGASFDSLAEKYSDDNATKDLGGDLGWIQLQALPSPLKDSVAVMKPGDIKGPIPSEYGYHIVKFIDRREAQKPTKEQFAQMVYQQKMNEALQAEYQKLSKEIYIDIKVQPDQL